VVNEKVKILLVDDLEENLIALSALIRGPEIQIFTARSGNEALELLLRHDFGLAMIDVQMPVMDGFELAALMKSTEKTKAVPIIFVTAGSRDQERLFKGYESGAVDFLYKPLDALIVKNKVKVFFQLDRQKKLLVSQLEQIRESEEFKNRIIESSRDCIQVLSLDGTLLSMSASGKRLLELKNPTSAINAPWFELWRGDDLQHARDAFHIAASGGTGHFIGYCITQTGKPKWLDVVVSPITNSKGQPEKLLAVARDVTEQSLYEEALKESEGHFRLLAEAIPQIVFTADSLGSIDYWNKRWTQYTGDSLESGTRKGLQGIIFPDQIESYLSKWKEAIQSGEPFSFEALLKDKQSQYRWHLVRAIPLRNSSGQIFKWFGTFTEIHAQKQLEEDLKISQDSLRHALEVAEKSLQLREEFLSIASHELNTPLTPLKLHIQMISRAIQRRGLESLRREHIEKFLNTSDRQVSRLAGLVNDLLDVSRISNGKFVFKFEEVDLAELVQETLESFSEQLRIAKCQVEVKTEVKVLGHWDRQRIQQVLSNLISNAVKYGAGKPISISIGRTHDSAHIEIQDHGIGISKSDQQRIFDKFERAIMSTSGISGLGLGLYIVKEIINAHHGTISISSEPEKGCTVSIGLPLSQSSHCDVEQMQQSTL
jgi:PAS domain S-box-containing protein